MKVKVTTTVIYICAATSIAWLLLSLPQDNRPPLSAVVASVITLTVASGCIFLKPRFSYCLGLASSIVALHWLWQIEFRYFPALNSWIAFNLPDGNPIFFTDIFLAKLRILFAVTVVASTTCSLIRLLPARWVMRKHPLRERTWPAFAVCFLIIVSWYVVSASPYRIPLIVDRVQPELTILHVEKRGIQFHETTITPYRDRKFYVKRNDRRLFQYRFAIRNETDVMPETMAAHVYMMANSAQLRDLRTAPAIALRNKNAEGWYVLIGDKVLAFTTEYGTKPPKEVVDLFHDLESVAKAEKERRTVNDICMGFCYDPLAGLGLDTMRDRCEDRNGIRCK